MIRVYAQNSKQLFSLTDKLGEGGEGTVFAWPSDPMRVCKVYHDFVLQERGDVLARKLNAMLAAPPDDPMRAKGSPTFAWPEELICEAANHKRLLGFVMPRIHESHSLHRLYSPSDRKLLTFPSDREGRPLPEYYVMVATARNLAEAFRLLHARGYVMADVNEDNIRFRTDATVSLIDNDSFQVRDRSSGEKFLVPVLKAEYWPADSLGLHARGEALSASHDQFCLALFLFRLLMNGVHPYHGMGSAGVDPPSSVENIAAGRFPFVSAHSGGLRPPLYAPAFESLPSELQEMFRRSFAEGARLPSARADAGTWVSALDRAHRTLKRCSRGHLHFAEARVCPWCALEDARVTCAKGHRYYRAEGSCPQCRLEQQRAARRSGTPSQTAPSVTVPPSRTAPPVMAPAPRRPAPPSRPVTAPGRAAPQRIPGVIGLEIALILVSILGCISYLAFVRPSTAVAGNKPLPFVNKPLPLKISGKKAVNPQDGAQLILIPAGSFQMGDDDQSDNKRRKVTLPAYYMYKNDVTVAQYKKFCKATGRAMPPAPFFDPNWSQLDHPIVSVSWNDAEAYCKWAGVRLPTEQEWEKAARGTDGRKYPWGNDWDASKCANDTNSLGGTVAVGRYTDSPYGLSDMAGNVWQWCADDYDGTGQRRALRGGSWNYTLEDSVRCADRGGDAPDGRYDYFGFRCVARPDFP